MYYADFVTGQPIAPGEEAVFFLLQQNLELRPFEREYRDRKVSSSPACAYQLESLPLHGRLADSGYLADFDDSFAARYTAEVHQAAYERNIRNSLKPASDKPVMWHPDDPWTGAEEESIEKLLGPSKGAYGEWALRKLTLGDIVQSAPAAVLGIDTFQFLISLAQTYPAIEPTSTLLQEYAYWQATLETPEGKEFLSIRDRLEKRGALRPAFLTSLKGLRKAKHVERYPEWQEEAGSFSAEMYLAFNDVFRLLTSLDSSHVSDSMLAHPVTGEKRDVPAIFSLFSGHFLDRNSWMTTLLAGLYRKRPRSLTEAPLLLEQLSQIQQVNEGLRRLGKTWGPSICMEEDFSHYRDTYENFLKSACSGK